MWTAMSSFRVIAKEKKTGLVINANATVTSVRLLFKLLLILVLLLLPLLLPFCTITANTHPLSLVLINDPLLLFLYCC